MNDHNTASTSDADDSPSSQINESGTSGNPKAPGINRERAEAASRSAKSAIAAATENLARISAATEDVPAKHLSVPTDVISAQYLLGAGQISTASAGAMQGALAAATTRVAAQNTEINELLGKQIASISTQLTSPITEALTSAIGADVFANLDWSKNLGPLSGLRIAAAESIIASISPSISMPTIDFDFSPTISKMLDSINTNTWFGRAISSEREFKAPPAPPSAYSADFTSAGDFFGEHERIINSFAELNRAMTVLMAKNPGLPLVWRGARNAQWAMHSSLFRHLLQKNGVADPSTGPRGPQPFPNEAQMVAAEMDILTIARDKWRFDGIPALEVFARIQHYGGPTRLIDVTTNPHTAAWFAVEQSPETDDVDGRIFALATQPVLRAGDDQVTPSLIKLDEIDGGTIPSWHKLGNNHERQQHDWGTGAKRRLWTPPAYDPRITAQNAGFILDGVPIMTTNTFKNFKRSSKYDKQPWTASDLLASSSMLLKMASPSSATKPSRGDLAPTFSWRVTPAGKRDIRRFLEERFGYHSSTIYPDNAGLSSYLGSTL